MLALARKINHWALGHYRAAMEDHNHLRNDPYLKRRRQYLLFVAAIEFQKPIYQSHFQAHQRHRTHESPPLCTNIHGLLRWFFNKPKPATESFISTTYKLRDVQFPMAEEGCKLEGLGQDILHSDRRCSALSVGKIPLHGCAIKLGEEQN